MPFPDGAPASAANHAPVAGRQKGPFAASAYHVPPARFTAKPYAYRYDDTLNLPKETSPQPERCQFMFSDGRQCTMARSDIHPSLCCFHAEREHQLFGEPSPAGSVVGRSLDLPELYSACGDLTTAAGVNRALGVVFRLLAQRRISRQEAATFAKLAQLLLQSLSAMRAELVERQKDVRHSDWRITSLLPHENIGERRISSQMGSPLAHAPSSGENDNRTGGVVPTTKIEKETLPESPQDANSSRRTRPASSHVHPSAPPMAPTLASQPLPAPTAVNSLELNPPAASVCNSREISTSKISELKTIQNEHLHQNGAALCSSGRSADVSRRPT